MTILSQVSLYELVFDVSENRFTQFTVSLLVTSQIGSIWLKSVLDSPTNVKAILRKYMKSIGNILFKYSVCHNFFYNRLRQKHSVNVTVVSARLIEETTSL